ncbi:MAG TPA: formylglycine-generating enzyme family protein [Myxococcota bacterium]|mgnify:CR=1 FL=1|nr:formylglycine-generating enzyme family protein [Myxococcota bacterium]HQK50262.1 formylglycine-generating enzyme family protein [Myxococcota bacterium]
MEGRLVARRRSWAWGVGFLPVLWAAVACGTRPPPPATGPTDRKPAPMAGREGPTPEEVRGTSETPLEVPEGMVHVPEGPFPMGCDPGRDGPCARAETPARTPWVSGFFIDRTEVTVAAYRACVEAGVCSRPVSFSLCNYGSPDRGNFPVNCVTWDHAATYCRWRHGRLPTEAEWEKAARGTDGRPWPWGREPFDDGGVFRANLGEGFASVLRSRDHWELDAPVGFYPEGASPFGALDMAGNLAEWVEDGYREPYDLGDLRDPRVGETAEGRVVRGGSFRDPGRRARTYAREFHPPESWYDHVGFRCVRPAPR